MGDSWEALCQEAAWGQLCGEDANANGDCPSREGASLLYHKRCGEGMGNGRSLLLTMCKCNAVNEAIGHT